MKRKGLVISLTIIFVLQIVMIFVIIGQVKMPVIDRVYLNEIIYEQGLESALNEIDKMPKSIEKVKQALIIMLVITVFLEIMLLLIYLVYLQKIIFKPFNRLKKFASKVANGDLETPLPMDKQNSFGAFTESFDLMRDALKISREQELLANSSKKELIAKLSHDIKTPISSISAVTELMMATNGDEKTLNQLLIIQNKASQIDRLVSDLFNATLEELQQLNVSSIEQSSEVILELIKNADFQNKANISNIPPCLVMFDLQRLQQVFDNIISNAYKYGGNKILVKATLQNSLLVLEFFDFGEGISDEELPLIFEKYYRGKNAEQKSGAGLGFYISRYLIREMGGDITCKNTEKGFCVLVSLKLTGNFEN